MNKYTDIVFDKMPNPYGSRFIEVENQDGKSIKFGEWVHRDDGYVALRIKNHEADLLEALERMLDPRDMDLTGCIDQAEKTIKKAKGE